MKRPSLLAAALAVIAVPAAARALPDPTVDLSPDGTRYSDWRHTADDTLDKINPHDLAQATAVWAAFLHTVANSDIDFRALKPAGAPPPERRR